MSTITKQAVQAVADLKAGYTIGNADVAILNELARIALASLEAEPAIHRWRRVTSEPYGPYPWHYGDFIGFSKPVDGIEDEYFYSAPPAPANAEPAAWLWSHRKHPSEVSLVRPEDDERAEGAHWSGWSCHALYAAPPAPVSVPDEAVDNGDPNDEFDYGYVRGWNECRAAMLQGAEPVTTAYKLPPHVYRELVNSLRDTAVKYQGCQQLREQISETLSSVITHTPHCGNSPVIPDGWALVPVEPTAEMISSGIAAHYERSQIQIHDRPAPGPMECAYVAMLAAAPQKEVK